MAYLVDDLEVFVAVVDAQSFTAAGRELRVTTAVVSSRIQRLERRLGARLLTRTTRAVAPTEEGRVFYDHARRMLEEAERAALRLAEMKSTPAGALRVSAPVALGRRHVAPIAPDFVGQHPKLQIRLQLTDRVADLANENIDLAVRTGPPPSSSLLKRRLADDLRIVCAAPDYYRRHGAPTEPAALKEHTCLLLRFPGSQRYFWSFETEKGEPFKTRLVGPMDSDNSDALLDWALAGHGLIMTSVWEVDHHLRDGRLLACLPEYWPRGLEIYAVMPPHRRQPTKTRAFLDALIAAFKSPPASAYADRAAVPLWRGAP